MMRWTGRFTPQGQRLLAKMLAGNTALHVSRVLAGSGNTAEGDSGLASPRQELSLLSPIRDEGQVVTLPVTLEADLAVETYPLTELGVYAHDPEKGEILYQIYRLEDAVEIVPGSRLVLRIYLQEVISQNLNVTVEESPAGLVTEVEFAPVRDKVEAISAARRSVTVAAKDLQAYLNRLPRLLTETLTISVTGDLNGGLSITNFYGSSCWLMIRSAQEDSRCIVPGTVTVGDCSVPVRLMGLSVQMPSTASEGMFCYRTMKLSAENCSFSGPGSGLGVHPADSMLHLHNCSISGFGAAVQTSGASTVVISNDTLDNANFHDNSFGVQVWHGGLVEICDKTPPLLGGMSHIKTGGLIVGPTGALL